MENETDKPNGPVAAAFLAGGIGSAVLGLATLLTQTDPTSAFSKSLVWVQSVGNLSGKSSLAIMAFLISWIILHLIWRGRRVNFNAVSIVAFLLLAAGLIGTFPPVWHIILPLPPPS